MPRKEKALRLISRIAAGIIALCACLVLLGWMLAIPVLKSCVPGLVAMNPSTAVLFLMTAVGLGLQTLDLKNTRLEPLRLFIGGLIFICGLAVVLGVFFHWQMGIDRILFAESLGENRMAPNTATHFALVGLAFLTFETRWADKWPAQSLPLIVLGGALMSLLGYGYGVKTLYGVGNYIPMALNTAILFAITAVGLLCVRGAGGVLALLTGSNSGSAMARWLLPTAVIGPCILGFCRVLGQRAGLFDTEFGTALMVLAMVILLVAAIAFTASALNRADAESKRAEERFRLLLNSTAEAIYGLDLDGNCTFANSACLRLLGYRDLSALLGTNMHHLCHHHRPDATPYPIEECRIYRAFQRGIESHSDDEVLWRADGTSFPVEYWSFPVRQDGQIVGSVVTFLDITERVRGADALRAAHLELQSHTQLLQAILNGMGDGVVVANERGQFVQFNPAAERILGLGPSDVGPEEWTSQYGCFLPDGVTLYPPDQLPLARALRGDTVAEEELFIRNAGCSQGAWIRITGRPLREASGAIKGGVVVFRDVSERKRAEEALRNSHEELECRVRARTADLADANRDLLHKNQENEMFVYSVSHDLRSPLVNLQGFSRELAETNKELRAILSGGEVPESVRAQGLAIIDENMKEAIHFIQTAVTRLATIIDSLLRLSRAGRIEHQPRRVEPGPIVGRVVESLSVTAECGADVSVGELPPLWVDPAALEQIVANLIGNALKYLDPGRPGEIEVGWREARADEPDSSTEGLPALYVRDNGLGIAESCREKIFQAFQRAHTHVDGDGIGLAIVRRLVERHGGSVWVQSEVGLGSTFFVSLPPAPCAASQEPKQSRKAREGERNGSRAFADSAG